MRDLDAVDQFQSHKSHMVNPGAFSLQTLHRVNALERGSQVHFMAEFQALFDFPPAPKLAVIDGKLDPRTASAQELRGQEVFFGKGRCSTCHRLLCLAPFNLLHPYICEPSALEEWT